MRAYRETIDLADRARIAPALFASDDRDEVTQSDLKQWQRLIGSEQHEWGDYPLSDRSLGAYRKHDIRISGVGAIGSRWLDLQRDMNLLWTQVLSAPKDDDDALARAAVIHHTYERIHPFPDGNGRSGRLLALWYLRRHGARPVLFTAGDRHETYYPSFRTADPSLMVRYFREHQVSSWD